MTKPTEEQIKALKPGDRVLVEATISTSEPDKVGDLVVRGLNASGYSFVHASVIHSILPREIKVGDKVRYIGWAGDAPWEVVAGPRPCRLRAVEYALWREGDGFESAPANSLEVVS